MSSKIWVVGAGKGGVGKTFITSSLGISLSKLNQSILLVDFDLSGANLHTTLGLSPSNTNLSLYLRNEAPLLNIIQPTKVPKLSYVQGAWDQWVAAPVDIKTCKKLVDDCKHSGFDIVIFDLGPGATEINLEFFNLADERILVTSAEPTSIEKSYRFIETCLLQKLKESSTAESFEKLYRTLAEYRTLNNKSHFSFRQYLQDAAGFSLNPFDELSANPIRLVVNGSRNQLDQDLGFAMKSICSKYFDVNLDFVGSIDYDNAAWQAVRNREAMLVEKPFTPLAGQFLSLCKKLLNNETLPHQYKAVV